MNRRPVPELPALRKADRIYLFFLFLLMLVVAGIVCMALGNSLELCEVKALGALIFITSSLALKMMLCLKAIER